MIKIYDKFDYQINSPVLIYSFTGKKLEAYGMDNNQLFATNYFLVFPNNQESDCVTLQLLVPIAFCGYSFLKPIKSTITVSKACITGIQAVTNVDVNTSLTIKYPFSDCIQGKFSIARGYLETTIWQASNMYPFKGNANIVYTSGDDPFIYVALYSMNDKLKTIYKVYKYEPFSFEFTNKAKIIVSKSEMDTKITGKFQFNVTGEILDKVYFNSGKNEGL